MTNNDEILIASIINSRQEVKTDKMDFSLGELSNMYKEGELVIKPDFQRLYQWNNKQKTDFIESILLGIPIPSIFVVEKEDGTWHIVDGLQRMTTILSFLGDMRIQDKNINDNMELNFTLCKGSKVPELDGYAYNNLPKRYKLAIKRASIRVEIIKIDSGEFGIEYELFKRLNSGGVALNKQEMRNAMFRVDVPKLFDYLDNDLEHFTLYDDFTQFSDNKKRRLLNHELLLRVLCLKYKDKWNTELEESATGNIDETLNEWAKTKYDPTELIKLFEEALRKIKSEYENDIFKGNNGVTSTSLFENVLVMTMYAIENERNIKKNVICEIKGNDEYNARRNSTNAASAYSLKERFRIAKDIYGF